MPIEALAETLPELSQDTTLLLHLLALGSIGLFIGLPFVSFKGGAARVNRKFATNSTVLIALAAAVSIIIAFETMIETIYDLIILSGYQALGIVLIVLPMKILYETNRNVDLVLGGCMLLGVLFLFHPEF